jgi:GDP-mannose 4,6-dehydratase
MNRLNQKVLVTGASGFIGGQVAPMLVEQGYDTYAFERYVTGRYVLGSARKVKTLFGDLRDNTAVRKAVREINPDYVLHIAAISPVAYSYDHPQEVVDTNLMGTINLAEACLQEVPSFKQFLFASTSETYGDGPVPRKEDTPQRPNSPYAVSKAAAEKYLLYMKDAYNFPITILRNFNTYGRRDNTHFVVERTIIQMLAKQSVVRLGDPTPIRDLMYVDDHARSYITCLGNEHAIGGVFNFCTGRGITIKNLVEMIAEITEYQGEIVWDTIPRRPLDIKELIGDYSKAKQSLDWSPKYSLREGLKTTVEHWRRTMPTP